MQFRAKTSDQVAREMDGLSSRYNTTRFRLVDNIIDLKYIDTLFGRFAAGHYDLDVFMETKANLTKQQIRTLAQGGVKCMQPGIESLSAAQLKEMDKGVSPLQNVQCLKWSRYYNLDINWNILLGFPQETNADYKRQIALIPSLFHLQPPESTGKLWLERFSPYFMRPEEYGVRITGPGAAYEYVYDARKVDLNKIAYDFEYEIDWKVDPDLYNQLCDLVQEWRARYFSQDRPFLFYAKAMSYVTVYDGRTDQPTSERFDWPFRSSSSIAMRLRKRWSRSGGLQRTIQRHCPRKLPSTTRSPRLRPNGSWSKTRAAISPWPCRSIRICRREGSARAPGAEEQTRGTSDLL